MARPLLERQASLLNYLTSGAAIFGGDRDAPLHPGLRGIDPDLLRLEARFSHQKRMDKISAVFPRTFELLGNRRIRLVQRFAEICPPTDISRLANACQFFDFLTVRRGLRPAFLRDVAACELACARVRLALDRQDRSVRRKLRSPKHVRRNPAIALQRCDYDVRPIFEQEPRRGTLRKQNTSLAIAIPSGADSPKIFELAPAAFDVLAALDDWTEVSAFGGSSESRALLAELRQHGLVEVSG
jgi:hypothetical protein